MKTASDPVSRFVPLHARFVFATALAQTGAASVTGVKSGGSTGPVFYNYSESPPKMLSWVKGALQGL